MPSRALTFCKWPGCNSLCRGGYCDQHMPLYEAKKAEANKRYEKSRGSAASQGYNYRWDKYSKWFLRKPGNQICKLHLPGCTLIATCTDHIDPPSGPNDPKFWDTTNHQASCIRCNSVKGRKKMKGDYDMMEEIENGRD